MFTNILARSFSKVAERTAYNKLKSKIRSMETNQHVKNNMKALLEASKRFMVESIDEKTGDKVYKMDVKDFNIDNVAYHVDPVLKEVYVYAEEREGPRKFNKRYFHVNVPKDVESGQVDVVKEVGKVQVSFPTKKKK